MKHLSILICFHALYAVICRAETIDAPGCALKSHETLVISRIEITSASTLIYLTIENRIQGGNFCADRNIFLIEPDGTRLKLVRSAGIPVCPDSYRFRTAGEKLQFSLEFPPLKNGIKWFDLIEECSANCFWFYGLTLDPVLNKRLDDIFTIASKGKPSENISLFRSLLESIDSLDLGIEGLIYINIINASVEDGDKAGAMVWYNRLLSSHAPRLGSYIKYLNDKGIKY
jgi:hypothetical protein